MVRLQTFAPCRWGAPGHWTSSFAILGMAARIPWSVPRGPRTRFPELAAADSARALPRSAGPSLSPRGLGGGTGRRGAEEGWQERGHVLQTLQHSRHSPLLFPVNARRIVFTLFVSAGKRGAERSRSLSGLAAAAPTSPPAPRPAAARLLLPYLAFALSNSSSWVWERLCPEVAARPAYRTKTPSQATACVLPGNTSGNW